MKTDQPKEERAGLSALLKEWKTESSLPPRFQEQVWGRIERAETRLGGTSSGWKALAARVASFVLMPRPAFAVACALALLTLGATTGWIQARKETARVSGELSARYAQAVDPYLSNP